MKQPSTFLPIKHFGHARKHFNRKHISDYPLQVKNEATIIYPKTKLMLFCGLINGFTVTLVVDTPTFCSEHFGIFRLIGLT